MKKGILVIGLLLGAFASKAQFTLTGEINPRAEFRNGFKSPLPSGADPAFFIEQRSRLSAGFLSEKYEIKLTLQDVRMWGSEAQINKTSNSVFSAVDAWGKYNFSKTFSVKLGRQMISYDNQRFFGGLEWAMQGRRHDALLLMYEKEGLKLHVGGAYNQNPVNGAEPGRLTGNGYTTLGNYKHMEFIYFNKKSATSNLSLYLVNDTRQFDQSAGSVVAPIVTPKDSTSTGQTYLAMYSKEMGKFKLDLEGSYQGGKRGQKDLSAYMFSIAGTYKTDLTPITIGYDHLSGTDTGSKTDGTWTPDYGTNHAFYGHMDYFFVGNPNGNSGLQDIFLKTKFKVAGGALAAEGHYFMTAAKLTTGSDATLAEISKGLGTEIDLYYTKTLTEGVVWKLGYSQMFATDSMLAIKGVPTGSKTNSWAWTQITFSPKFL